jgi:hypothetical protein
MFEKNIVIKGRHAKYMKELAAKFSSDMSQGIFARNLDVYLLAPIVGKLYNKKSEVDNEFKDDTSIHTEQMYPVMDQLEFNYRTIILLENKASTNIETRIDKAFRYDRNDEKRLAGDKIFEQYVLGGIDVLHEKLMEGVTENDDYLKNIYQFVCDFNRRYYKQVDPEEIYNLCKLASN